MLRTIRCPDGPVRRLGPTCLLPLVLLVACQRQEKTAEPSGPSRQQTESAAEVPGQRQRGMTTAKGPVRVERPFYRRQWAVVIGISNYDQASNGYGALNFPRADAEEVFATLRDEFGYAADDMRLLINGQATRASITKTLAEWPPRDQVHADDCFLFYYAGHGVDDKKDSYLLPSDGRARDLGKSAVALAALRDKIEAIPCRHKLIVLDACFAGALFRGVQQEFATPAQRNADRDIAFYLGREAFIGLSAGRYTTVADGVQKDGHSPFTRALLDALRERADTPRADHVFNLRLLASRIEAAVAAQGLQVPECKYLGPGDGDFLFRPTIERLTPREKETWSRYAGQLADAEKKLTDGQASTAAGILSGVVETYRGWEWRHLRFRGAGDKVEDFDTPGKAPARAIVFSRDGHWLAIGSGQPNPGGAALVDLAAGRRYELPIRGFVARAVDLDAAGRQLAVGVDDQVVLFSVDRREESWRSEAHPGGVAVVAFSAQGDLVATGGEDGHVRVWQAADGKPVGEPLAAKNAVRALAWSSDAVHLAAASGSIVTRWNLRDRTPAPVMDETGVEVRTLTFRGDPQELVSVDAKGAILSRGLGGGAPRRLADPRQHDVQAVAWNAAGDIVAVAHTAPPSVKVTRTASGESVDELPGLGSPLALNNDGTLLAACEGPTRVRISRLASRPWQRVYEQTGRVNGVALGREGLAASVDEQGKLHVWNAWTMAPLFAPRDHASAKEGVAARAVAISPDETRIATSGTDGTIRLWDAQTGALAHELPYAGEGDAVTVPCLAFDPHGKALAAGGANKTVKVWRYPSLEPWQCLEEKPGEAAFHTHSVNSLVFFDQGRGIFSTAAGPRAKNLTLEWLAWNVDDRRRRFGESPKMLLRQVGAVACSTDGKRLAVAGAQGSFLLYDAASGRLLFDGIAGPVVTSLAFHPDSQRLVVGDTDGQATLWHTLGEVTLLNVIKPFDSSKSKLPIRSLAFSGDGHLLAIASGKSVHVYSDQDQPTSTSTAR